MTVRTAPSSWLVVLIEDLIRLGMGAPNRSLLTVWLTLNCSNCSLNISMIEFKSKTPPINMFSPPDFLSPSLSHCRSGAKWRLPPPVDRAMKPWMLQPSPSSLSARTRCAHCVIVDMSSMCHCFRR